MILDRKLERLSQTQSINPKEPVTFYPRVVNNTNIPFTRSETTLLQKGLKYNVHAKRENWIQNLALEAETAISLLPTNERQVHRKLVADRIDTLNQKKTLPQNTPRGKNDKINPEQTEQEQRYDSKRRQRQFHCHTTHTPI